MDYKADIGLVDSHSKRDCGHDDVNLAFDEFVLVVGAFLVGKARVVCHRADSPLLKFLRNRVDFLARKAVNDSAFVFVFS